MNTIPWYKSNTLRALVIALLVQVVTWIGLTDNVSNEEVAENVDRVLAVIEFLALAWAAWARLKQPTPPITEAAAQKMQAMQLESARTDAGVLRSHWLVAAFVAVVVAAGTFGCTTTPTEVVRVGCAGGTAYKVERCADTLARVYNIYQTRALEITQDAQVPTDVKEKIRKADAEATPVVRELIASSKQYMDVRDALQGGTTEDEKLRIANANLERWIAQAVPRINALIASIGG